MSSGTCSTFRRKRNFLALECQVRFLTLKRFASGSFSSERERTTQLVSGLKICIWSIVSPFSCSRRGSYEGTHVRACPGVPPPDQRQWSVHRLELETKWSRLFVSPTVEEVDRPGCDSVCHNGLANIEVSPVDSVISCLVSVACIILHGVPHVFPFSEEARWYLWEDYMRLLYLW